MVVAVPLSHRVEYVLDLFCGTATSATLYHLVTNPNARAIGIDRDHDERWVRAHLPAHVQRRFHFEPMDVVDLTVDRLEAIMARVWPGVTTSQLTHAHASSPCGRSSNADRGRSGYRNEWAQPLKGGRRG